MEHEILRSRSAAVLNFDAGGKVPNGALLRPVGDTRHMIVERIPRLRRRKPSHDACDENDTGYAG